MDQVCNDYLNFFQKHYEKISINYNSDKAAVIVEPRQHPHLEFVIKNIMYFLPSWSLYIFHSNDNDEFVKNIIGLKNRDKVHYNIISPGNITIEEHNELLTSPYFYEKIHAEDILIFQTDSYIRKSGIECFLEYNFAMIGAPWHWYDAAKPQGGNGGFCFRKNSIMKKITREYPYSKLDGNEDVYFHFKCNLINANLPYPSLSKTFSVETILFNDPYATHKGYHYLQPFDINLNNRIIYIPKDKNKIFGDPCYGKVKQFIIIYPNGNKLFYNEHEDFLLNINSDMKFLYGNDLKTIDITPIIENIITIQIPKDKNSIFGDPIEFVPKFIYWIRDGKVIKEWTEDEEVLVNIFKNQSNIFKYGTTNFKIDITNKIL
jgi:hypothetical protein